MATEVKVVKSETYGRKPWSDQRVAYLMILPVIILLFGLIIYPFIMSIWISFHWIDFRFGMTWEWVGADNYIHALDDKNIQHAIVVSIEYAFMVTALCFGLGLMIALMLNEKFVLNKFLIAVLILPYGISRYASAIVWKFIFSSEIGLVNLVLYSTGIIPSYIAILTVDFALFAVAIAHSWQIAPLAIYFMLATLTMIPQDLYKTARLDKLGPFGRFRNVTFPYLKFPSLIILVLITVEAIRVFDIMYFLTRGGPGNATETLTYETYKETFLNLDLGYGAAISYIEMAIVIVITVGYFVLLFPPKRKKKKDQVEYEGAHATHAGGL